MCYGGDLGPDLADVAAFAGCSEAEVVDLHAGREYRVYMVGFVPGFAYMAEVESRIAAPRRASPRTAVPAGSVAIAGGQTGDLPGRHARRLEPHRSHRASAVRSGSRAAVSVQVRRPRAISADPPGRVSSIVTQSLTVVRAGMLTTIQDLGRWGFQANGVPVAGPMDAYSHALANRLVGNPPTAAAIEVTLIGPELQGNGEVVCAVAGATFALTAGDVAMSMHIAFTLRSGERLRFGARSAGARATLAVRGGIDVPSVFDSRATSLISRMGPFGGRALRAGDVLPIGPVTTLGTPGAGRPVVPLPLPGRRRTAPRRGGSAGAVLHTSRVSDTLRVSVHRHARVQSHGVPARRGPARTRGTC